VTVQFSEAMNPSTINTANLHLRVSSSSTDVPASVSYSGFTATLASAARDQAAQDLRALLDIKLQGQPAAAPEPTRMVLPLLAALQQSVAAQAGDGAAARGKARAPRKRTKRTA
jgi:hypothetical protein